MSYNLTSHLEGKVMVFALSGHYEEPDVGRIIEQLSEQQAAAGVNRVLVDSRQYEGRASITDTFFMAQKPSRTKGYVRVACLDHESNQDYARFHELVHRNAGLDLRNFHDYDKAMAWLNEISS